MLKTCGMGVVAYGVAVTFIARAIMLADPDAAIDTAAQVLGTRTAAGLLGAVR